MLFHEENLVVSQAPYIPTHVDKVVHRLLAGYHGLPFYVVPFSRIYETTNASTYDTLQATYVVIRLFSPTRNFGPPCCYGRFHSQHHHYKHDPLTTTIYNFNYLLPCRYWRQRNSRARMDQYTIY